MVYIQKTENKYHAKSQTYNNITYHSKFEAGYAAALDLAVKAGDIKKWERQVKLDLKVNGQHITNYYIDFIVHHNDGSREFTELKGMEMETWKMKWKILEATFDEFKKNPDDSLLVLKQTSWGPPRRRK
jgi:carboxypeptidase C (cathepsin A)